MEAERLLNAISEGNIVLKDIQNYLGPLTSGSTENVEKYQQFSLKALKLVIQQLNKINTQRDKRFFLKLSDILIASVGSNVIINQNITPFSFEKLLINLVNEAAKFSAINSMMLCCLLVKERLQPLTDNPEASSLLICLANVLWQILSTFEQNGGQDWEHILRLRLLSLEMFCLSYQNKSKNAQGFVTQVNLVKKYSLLINVCLKRGRLGGAMNTIKAMLFFLPRNLLHTNETVGMMMADFVRIKQAIVKQDPSNEEIISMKDISADAGLGDDIISCFLEEELVVYENNANDNNTIPWKLHVIEELLIVYKKTSSVSLQRAYLMIKKASIYYELNDKQQVQTPLQLVCEAIAILESMKGGSSEESCMMFDLLGHGYLWKAIILYSELISSQNKDVSCIVNDNPVITALGLSVTNWKKLQNNMKSCSIVPNQIKNCFRQFHSTCNHIKLCISLCSVLSLIPQAVWCVDVLTFLAKWNNSSNHKETQISTLQAYKTRLLMLAYGEKFVDSEIESTLKTFTEKEESHEQLECLLVLALLSCKRGKFSCCNNLLREAVSSSLLSKNTLGSHRLMASLTSVTSHYIEAQSHDLPLVDTETCLTRLISKPSPICISCIKDSKAVCHCTGYDRPNKQAWQTELELSIDSLNLTRGLSQIYANKYSKQHGRHDQSTITRDSNDSLEEDCSVPVSLTISFSSTELWDNTFEILTSLYRVSKLFIAREAMKESLHYINEGLELAKLMCFRYWSIKFLLLLSSVKDLSGCYDEGDELRKEIEQLLHPTTTIGQEKEQDISKLFSELTIKPLVGEMSLIKQFSDHPSTCACVDCINPVRVIVILEYLHQIIERNNYSNELIKYASRVSENGWTKACVGLTEEREQVKVKTNSNKRRQKASSQQIMQCFQTEVILPLKIKNTSLNIKSLVDQNGCKQNGRKVITDESQKALDDWNPSVLPMLHNPEMRLGLAELHFAIGQAKLQMADHTIVRDIYERVTPVKSSLTQSTQDRTRKMHHKRARRIIDSDEDEEEERKRDSRLQASLLPKLLVPFIAHFLQSYQLLSPTTLSLPLTKSLYNQLGVCLSIWRTKVAAHFILCSSYLSFSVDSVLWTWKKIRRRLRKKLKCHLSELVLKDISITLCSSPFHSDTLSSDPLSINLMTSRAILHCLTCPLPMSYTRQLIDELPSEWLFCNLCLIDKVDSSKENKIIMLVRVSKGKECIIVKMPLPIVEKSKEGDTESVKEDPLKQFQTIIHNSTQSTTLTDKRKWWSVRRNLDSQMKGHLRILQDELFGKWKVLLTSSSDPLPVSSLSRVTSLLSECGLLSPDLWAEVFLRGSQALDNKDDLLSIIQSLLDDYSSCSSAIEKIFKELKKCSVSPENDDLSPDDLSPLILSLGHPLHELPIENMPLLRNRPVSRIPSLPFLVAHSITCSNRDYTYVDPRLTYYIINPSGDLKNTEKTFAKWFEREEGWEGVVGKPPTSAQFVYGFEKRRVVIYCGHGRAREYLKDGHIQELDCQATVLQMGCSSGKLQNFGGNLEPNGIVFNFLLAGCPSLVVNLWDVTDVDIDRFCSALVKEWLSGVSKTDHYKLLQIVSEARDSCKLKYLVGASPVVYGLPVLRQ